MLKVRKSAERGLNKIDWLTSYHSFSFGHYYDPEHTSFSHLVVINDDYIKGDGGFPEHGHRDMEIVTYIISGELAHKDSLGNVATIKAGEVQRMSAGTGIRHSEFNYSKTEECRLLQVWFLPEAENRKPGYEQKKFSQNDKRNNLKLVVSPTGKDGALSIGQDVEIYASILEKDKSLNHKTDGRKIWLQVARGEVDVNGKKLIEGDGAHSGDEIELNIKALSDESEFIIFSIGK
jgi:redox-sensitive bicupin YhaK (pirin superfamily)